LKDYRIPGGMRNAQRRNGDGNPACTRQAEASRELHVKNRWRAGCAERRQSGSDRGPPEKDPNHRHLAGGLPV
jgi:hypothetical protein